MSQLKYYDTATSTWLPILAGAQGLTGTQGEIGTQGLTGSQGTQGLIGLQGVTGSQGLTGIQGSQGLTGAQGTTGSQGISGASILPTDNSWSGANTFTIASGTSVPITIQNNGTGNSFVVNDVASDTTPFVVTAAGTVGIGSSSVESGNILHIGGNAFLSPTTGTIGKLTIDNVDQRLILGSYFEAGVGQYSFITSTNNAETGNIDLLFNTGTTERMRITNAGLVGINVAPSGAMFTVANNTNGNVGTIIKGAASQTGDLLQVQNSAGTSLLKVNSAGNVGIGISTPATKFQVSQGRTTLNANAENFALQLNNSTINNGPFLGSAGADILVISASSGAERMRIDASGNVGIGTTAPSAKLEVVTTVAGTTGGLTVTNNDSTGYTLISTGTNAGLLRNGGSQSGYAGANSLSLFQIGGFPVGIITNNNLRMIVTANGDVGIGTASPTAKLDVNGSIKSDNLSARNSIINGAFDISQRGATITSISTDNTYTADRWYITRGGTVDYAQKTVAGGNNPPATFDAYAQYVNQSAGNPFLTIGQTLETKDSIRFAGQSVTFSFYARAAANTVKSKTLQASITYNTAADTKTNTSISDTIFTITYGTAAGDWARYSFTQTVPSTAKSVGIRFLYNPIGGLAVGDGVEITGVQLEAGSVATQFTRAGGTIQGELAACQRYYYRAVGGNNNSAYAMGTGTSTTVANFIVQLPVTFRTLTSATIDTGNLCISDGVTAASGGTFTASNVLSSQNIGFVIYTHGSATLTQYRPYRIENNSNNAGYIGFSAEL